MAFLAAIPATMMADRGAPSLIAVDEDCKLVPEVNDYLRRYRPDEFVIVGNADVEGPSTVGVRRRTLPAATADEAAVALSAWAWKNSDQVVACAEGDYQAGLLAAPLSARLHAPLLFVGNRGFSESAEKELRRLNPTRLIVVGVPECGTETLRKHADECISLKTTGEFMAWVKKEQPGVNYLALVNPHDRDRAVVRKLSLAGAMLASGRNGLVVPMNQPVSWKLPFSADEKTGEPPPGVPASEIPPKFGTLAMDGCEHAFVITGKAKDRDLALRVDINDDGGFQGDAEPVLRTGDTVVLGGRRYAVTLGEKNGHGKADLRLTWPTAEEVAMDLRRDYGALGNAPEYLCLVGFPDAVPMSIIGRASMDKEVTSDLVYADVDEDPFADIGVSRVIGENAMFATLFASRVLTYDSLLDPSWMNRACQARWENTYGSNFKNYGFDASYQHTKEDLKPVADQSNGNGAKRKSTFEQDSPLAECAALAHMDHSWWRDLGHTLDWNANVLLAPVVVESGGCSTASLDREPDGHSVVTRLLRLGAVSFCGNTREGIAASELQRQEFWNAMLAGETIGRARRRCMNSQLVAVLDRREGADGPFRYQLQNWMQFGDPAFKMHVPGPPRTKAAHVVSTENRIAVHAPEEWWPVRMFVPEDWKKWTGKDLYALRGAGVYPRRQWCREEYDHEEIFMTAEFTTGREVTGIEQVQNLPPPLGWNGSYHVDGNPDGSRTFRWSVRMADFNQTTGEMIAVVKRIDYRPSYQDKDR